jgi:hypothetical protein
VSAKRPGLVAARALRSAAGFALLAWAAVLASAPLGCATQRSRTEEMRTAIEGFNNAVRWNAYPLASGYVPNDIRAAFLDAYADADEKLRIEGFEIQTVVVPREDEAVVTLRVSFVEHGDFKLETRTLKQFWRRVGDVWVIENEENSLRKVPTWTLKPSKPSPKPSVDDEPDAPEFAPVEPAPSPTPSAAPVTP